MQQDMTATELRASLMHVNSIAACPN